MSFSPHIMVMSVGQNVRNTNITINGTAHLHVIKNKLTEGSSEKVDRASF
jgi:hypothetical protein